MIKNLASIRPFFIVRNLQASIAYYRDRLGFEVDFGGTADDTYAGVRRVHLLREPRRTL